MHEDLSRRHEVKSGSDRALGFVFAAVFFAIAAWPLFLGGALRLWSAIVAAGFLLAAVAAPRLLAPLNRLWTAFGLLLHRIVSPIVLGLLFYGVVTPMAVLGKLMGKDPLRLRRKGAQSYWIERAPPGPPPATMRNQF